MKAEIKRRKMAVNNQENAGEKLNVEWLLNIQQNDCSNLYPANKFRS